MDDVLRDALNVKFAPRRANRPYSSDGDYLRDLQTLLSLYLIILSSYQSAAAEHPDGQGGRSFAGIRLSGDEAAAHVESFPAPPPQFETEIAEVLREAENYIQRRLRAGQARRPLRLEQLRAVCGKSEFAFFCVLCALVSALDRGFEELFVALHGRDDLRFPTLGVAEALYRLGRDTGDAATLTVPPDLELLFFEPHTEPLPPLLQPLMLRRSALRFVLGEDAPAGPLQRAVLLRHTEASDRPPPDGLMEPLAACRAILNDRERHPRPRLVLLQGPAGSGRKTTLRLAGADGAFRFLFLRLDGKSKPSADDALCAELLVRSRLHGEHLCFGLEGEEGMARLDALLPRLAPADPCVFLLCDELRRAPVPEGYLVHRIDFLPPDLEQAVAHWERFAAAAGPDGDTLRPHELAAKYTLTPGRIEAAVESALSISRCEGVPLDHAVIDRAVRLGNSGRLREIADPIPVFYAWDDLVLGEGPKGMLRDVCNRIKYRHVVENRWGFRRRSAYGNGISILLYGPPGTGKTMSAGVLAAELGLPLYRINLAQMISKYIGETAKNLDAVFREAKSSNVILFFDEADALFAKRTDVKNSNDRHANSESAYLLQKIEEYDGVSILATNLAHNFDEAFRRRIQYMINIPLPSPEERERLWRGCVGADAPLAADVDFGLLARELELSGSVIKSAVLQAAYFAAAEDRPIGMGHLVRAVRLELGKLGKSEPHFMGQYK